MLWLALLLAPGQAGAAVLLGGLDFAAGDGSCVSEGETAQWSWGAITGGPGSGFDGANGWALNLGGGYLNDTVDTLTCSGIDLSGATRPVLVFHQWFDLDLGDTASIQVDDGSGWQTLTPVYMSAPEWSGYSGGWVATYVELEAFAAPFALRWVFTADASGVGAGWFLGSPSWWDGDAIAPDIESVDQLTDTEDVNLPQTVNAQVRDDTALVDVLLRYSLDGGAPVDVQMTGSGDGYSASIPGQRADTTVVYQVVARDAENESVSDAVTFRFYLPAPQDLHLDAERAIGHTVPLAWSAPGSTHLVSGYRVYRDGDLVAESSGPSAEAPVTGGLDTFTVTAVYGDGQGDASEPLDLVAAVPTVIGLDPDEGWPGDHVRLQLTGEYLLLADGDVTASLGDGVSVSVEVRDVDSAVLDVEIDDGALAGPRDLTLSTASGETVGAMAFTVLDGADRPRLVAEDITLHQGEEATVTFSYVGEMATSTPGVDMGEDIVVQSVSASAGTVSVTCAVSGAAALGDRTVVVDDGVRLFDGVTLTVLNSTTQGTGCASTSAPAAVSLALVGGLLIRRRKRAHSSKR